ncbi:MAG: N-acetyltransferase [Rhodocyclaceae bacterium]|nr:N-acetyltransferase [Rhodocyclaceae bacterium]MCC0019437.1 N-acetyltransferase [Rhodobiaceae bacterium]
MTGDIRLATGLDRDEIRNVHLRAFPEPENRTVAGLAIELLGATTRPDTLGLVAEVDGLVIGHIAFSPVTADLDEGWSGYILAPLGVVPEYQQAGVGSSLIEAGMARLSGDGVDVVLVYGDPNYYGRFGFAAAVRFLPPYELQYPFGWQAKQLHDDSSDNRITRISCVAALCDPSLW